MVKSSWDSRYAGQENGRFLPEKYFQKGMFILEIDVAALKRMIAEKNTTMEGMALFLGIDRSTLYRKLRDGGGGITVHDAHMIASFLGLSDHETIRIFWSAGKKPDANHRRKICCLPRSDGVF